MAELGQYLQYLQAKYRSETVKAYVYDVQNYVNFVGSDNAQGATYADILAYLGHLKQRNAQKDGKTDPLQRPLSALKTYYDFLIATDARQFHPCQDLILRSKRPPTLQLQDLFSPQELNTLLERAERYKLLKHRNQLIMSLLVHQALTAAEIVELKTDDLELDKATLNIRSQSTNVSRTLPLIATQIGLVYRYLYEDRPQIIQLIQGKKPKADTLILSKLGTIETTDSVQYLVSTFQPLFNPRKLTPTTIRQSVIANRLKTGEDLRRVQIFAGHRRISSTEKYKLTGLDALKIAVIHHHPLDKMRENQDKNKENKPI